MATRYQIPKKYARNGDRTHAHIRELDLKSNALTTRPSWLVTLEALKMNNKW